MPKPNDYGVVADLYDTYVPATFDIPFLLNEAKKSSGEVLELMSGTGRVSIPLLRAGVRLTCVDLSAEMNAVLRAKLETLGLQANLYQMDICALNLSKQFDLVMIPFHSFAHIVSLADQQVAFRRIHQHLVPGGQFLCTLGNPTVRRASVDGRLRLHSRYPLGGAQGTLLLWLLEKFNPDDDQIVEALEFFEEYDEKGMLRSKRLLELRFRLSSRAEIEALAVAAGFQVAAFYGDYACSEFDEDSSPFMIWLFRRA
jgi:SAM-dependent methyltransferase